MKTMDFVLIGVIILLATGILIYNTLQFDSVSAGSGTVIVRVNGNIYGSYKLDENREIVIGDKSDGDYNIISIQGGIVTMTDADCHDQICVRTNAISKSGQSIVCLPHRVVVEIIGTQYDESEVEIDAISQ